MTRAIRDGSIYVGAGLLAALIGCSSEPLVDEGDSATQSVGGETLRSEHAQRIVAGMRERYRTTVGDRSAALLGSSRALRMGVDGRALYPVFEARAALAARLSLPERANAEFSVEDAASNVALAVRLRGARDVRAVTTDGYVVYPSATAEGHTLVHRPIEHGTEDFVEIETAPAVPELRYDVRLGDAARGLRLVANTLEVLDASGTPRLRVAPPYVVTAGGAAVPAALDVEGCAADRDSAPPWGRPLVAPGAPECTVVVSWNAEHVTYPALVDPTWSTTASLSTARAGARSAVLANGRVLVAGGIGFVGPLDSAELYDPATGRWAATGSMATPRAEHAVTRRPNGHALATGGFDGSGTPLASTELYDPATGAWTTGAPMTSARALHRAIVLTTGDVLVAGGSTDAAERLSNATSSWSAAGRLVSAVTSHTLTLLADGRVLLVGGERPQLFQPARNTWTPGPPALAAFRFGHTATRLADGRVLVVGSETPSAEVFNPSAGTWQRAGAASGSHSGHTATSLSDGRVLIAGGYGPPNAVRASAELYSPTWGTLAPLPPVGTSRRDHVDAALPNGRAILAGGYDTETYELLSSTEHFDSRSLATVTTEYRLPAGVDADVLEDRATEIWASLTRPATLEARRRYPLLVFLHGNHGTCGTGTNPRQDFSCEYTDTGTCPAGYVVTPNHRGYDYVASALAGRGYFVVSINANRGINCGSGTNDDPGLNLARGRLILKHLQRLSEWNRGASATPASIGVSLASRLELGQVGIMGHSRGGEGARAAYEQYHDPGSPWPSRIADPLRIQAIFEIGPVDGQTSRVLNAHGAAWNVLLPACDGDVSDLQGIRPFDRMISVFSDASVGFKSAYTVWGANHNYYNTEWQVSDAFGCGNHRALFESIGTISSPEQLQTGLRSLYDFFVANVGSLDETSRKDLFNPELRVPFESPVERSYTPGQSPALSRQLEDFTRPAGTSTLGFANTHSRVSVSHGTFLPHDEIWRTATISWRAAGPSTFFQTHFAAPGSGVDLRAFDLLDFRAGRTRDALNIEPRTTLHVQLVNADGSLSEAVSTDEFIDGLIGPPAGPYGDHHSMLETVRIPLSRFGGANVGSVRGVRFSFQATPTGAIYLANVRATRSSLLGSSNQPLAARASGPQSSISTQAVVGNLAARAGRRVSAGNAVTSLRSSADGESIEITLATTTPFEPRAELLVIDVGGVKSALARHPSGNLKAAVFKVPRVAFEGAQNGAPLRVFYDGGRDEWDFGTLDKSLLDR